MPLNRYGYSKHIFDLWAEKQTERPAQAVGMKFFNVYGPNEYAKGRMASMIFHGFNQVKENNCIKLFKSHKEGYEDGGQLRDFVYVKDICDVKSGKRLPLGKSLVEQNTGHRYLKLIDCGGGCTAL